MALRTCHVRPEPEGHVYIAISTLQQRLVAIIMNFPRGVHGASAAYPREYINTIGKVYETNLLRQAKENQLSIMPHALKEGKHGGWLEP